MKITKQALLRNGFTEHHIENGICYVKGNIALIYIFDVWIPCHYVAGTFMADRLYVKTMEELELLNQEI